MQKFLAVTLLLVLSVFSFASNGDESAPMQEKQINYKNWTFKNLLDDKKVELRSFATGKKLVLVVYFAAWCPNWHREAPVVERLYQKYKDKGFDVVAVSEYASLNEAKKNINDNKFSFTVVTESESTDAKEKTTHYAYRKSTGDTRNWGSPWNIFLESDKLEKQGDVLMNKAFVVNGEIIESEVDKFIKEKLELSQEKKTIAQNQINKKVEVCEDPTNSIKKP
jgi:peroxiredoxin